MGTISIPQEPPPLIGPIFLQPPELPMSSPNSIHTLSSPSVSYATTTASPRLTKNQSRSTDTTPQSSKATVFQTVSGAYPSIPTNHKPMHYSQNKHNRTFDVTTTASPRLTKNQSRSTDTTPQSSKATVFQTVSGAYPSIPTNHKPMHYSQNKHNGTFDGTTTASPRLTKNQSRSTNTTPQSSKATVFQTVSGAYPSIPTNHKPMHYSQNKHNGTLFNGSTPPPSVPVSALSSRPPNEIFSSPGPILHPRSFDATCNLQFAPPKAISTNNDNVAANHSTKRHHQLTSPHKPTPFMQRFSIPNNQPATPSVTSLASSQFSRIVGPTTYSYSMTTTATLSSSDLYATAVHKKSNESSPPSTPT